MATATLAITRPPSPPLRRIHKPHFIPSPTPQPPSLAAPPTVALSSFLSVTGIAFQANALTIPKDDVVSSLIKVEETIDRVQDFGSKALGFTQSAIDALVSALRPGVDVALPALREALKAVSPVVSGASEQATEALRSAGVDPAPVYTAAKTVADAAQQTTKIIEVAKPIASSAVQTISSTEPSVFVASAGALFLAYLLLPPIWSAVSSNLRGYKGNLSPAQSLDLISTQNFLMIDIRSELDKNKAGIPRLPSSAKNKIISIPLEELPAKIKSLVRDTRKVEAEIVALKISYLKRVNRGSNIVIMDSYCNAAKIVAKALTSLGFKNCWVMADGFSGGRGWQQSRLGTDSYNVSIAEVLSPSRIIPAARARLGTANSSALRSNQKLLPGSFESR